MWRSIQEPNHHDVKIEYLEEGTIALVKLNRPKKYNAINFEMFDHIKEVFEYVGRNGSGVRAVVLAGEGKHFSAGIDLVSAMENQ